jgi:hypothetical protein
MLAIRLFFGVAAVFAAFAIPGVAAADVPGDATPPVLTLPADITVTAWQPAGAYVSWYDASAWDAGDNASVPVDCAPQSGSLFPLGATTVACSAADSSGNTATGSFTVTVLKPDTTPPVLNGIPSSPVILEPWDANGASYFYNVWATDNWDGWDPVTCTPPPGFFPIGSTTVQCSATDSWGNTATGSFTVTVLQPLVVTVTVTGGTVNPATGVATINGTIECTRAGAPATASAYLYGDITQRVGRTLITGAFGTMTTGGYIDCSSPATPWSYTAVSSNGLFVAGSADVRATGFAGMVQGPTVTTTIKLKAQK